MKITKKGKSASRTRICPSFWPVWCRLVSSKSCKKVVVASPFCFILCCPFPSDTTYCALLVQWLHRGDFEEHNFVMFHHASSSPRFPNNTGFYFPSCFILPRHRIGKWGKIWGNSRAVLNTHQMAVHYILYTPCFPVSNRGYDEKRGMPKASRYNRCSLSSAL